MSSMDTVVTDIGSVDNAPSSTPNPFLFTASEGQNSITSGTSTTMTPSEGLTTKTLLEGSNQEFITPDNQNAIPLIQPLSQSPYVPGKTPHAASTMTKSKLFTSKTASTTGSPSCNASVSTECYISSQITDSKSSTVDNVASSTTDSSIGQQDVECSGKNSVERISSDGYDVKENNVDSSTIIVSGSNTVRVDNNKDIGTTTIVIDAIHNESATISDAAYVQLDVASLTKGNYMHVYL